MKPCRQLFAWLSFILEDNTMKEKWIRCLKVEPGKIPEECTLENSLSALQEAVGGLIELLDAYLAVQLVRE